MKAIELGLLYAIAATSLLLSVAAAQPVSDSTRVYASLPSRIEINVPTQHENLQLQNCTPANQISVTGSVEVKSNLDWNLDVAGSTSDGRMHGTGTHELHDPMTVSALVPSGGPVAVPGTESSPLSSALLSNVAPGDYSGSSAIGLTFGQLFEWDDYADDSYQLTVTLTAGPA
jgi:hypothetical protein